jgi:hypothetical protein
VSEPPTRASTTYKTQRNRRIRAENGCAAGSVISSFLLLKVEPRREGNRVPYRSGIAAILQALSLVRKLSFHSIRLESAARRDAYFFFDSASQFNTTVIGWILPFLASVDQKSLAIPGHVICYLLRGRHWFLLVGLKSAAGAPELKLAPSLTGTATIFPSGAR